MRKPRNVIAVRNRYRRRRAAGLCGYCGKTPERLKTCDACLARGWANQLARAAGREYVKRPWATSDQTRLVDMYAAGETLAAIAATIGRTSTAVMARAREMGLRRVHPVKTWTNERVALLRKLLDAGQSHRQIGEHMGVSKDAINCKVGKLGLRKRGRPAKEDAPRHAVDSAARCPVCLLLLPHAGCVPRAEDYATARGEGGDVRSKAA